MRFTLRHPRRPHVAASYGFDPVLGFLVDVRDSGVCVGRYDALTEGYDRRWPLHGALNYLIEHGFLRREELEDVLTREPHELPKEMPRRVRRVALVVESFKEAAD